MRFHEYALLLWIRIIVALFQQIGIINGSTHALGSLNSIPETELSLWKLSLSVFPICTIYNFL